MKISKSLLKASVFLSCTASCATQALAWGPNGHAIVADIAETRLTPEARTQVQTLLATEGLHSLDQIASWADNVGHLPKNKGGLPETLPWHYVDVDVADTAYDQKRDCPDRLCVAEKLPEEMAVLRDPSASASRRLTALKWVVHLTGDVHQPLHAAERSQDKGGNAVRVTYFGQDSNGHMNLHSIWDEAIVDQATGLRVGPHYSIDPAAARAVADKLNTAITPDEALYWSADISAQTERKATIDWVDESHALARTVVYGALTQQNNAALGQDYATLAWPIARLRLEQAGVRLAAVLNEALGGH